MKKRLIFLAAVLFLLIVPNIVSSAKVDSQIFEKLNENQEVSVIVILKDKPSTLKGLSALNKADKNQILEQKKTMIKEQQDKVLSKLNLKDKAGNLIKSTNTKSSVSTSSSGMDFILKHKYSTVNGFSGKVTDNGLEKLMSDPDVKVVYLDKIIHATLDQSIPQINADDVWPIQLVSINITGLDETICIIDTGIDYNHSALGNGWGNKIITGYNAITQQECSINNTACFDDNGHGTHCAGIATSENETYKGVAPDAKLVAIKAMDSTGEGLDSDVIAGIDWCVNNASQFNISVISISSGIEGTAYNNTYCDADYSEFASALNSAVGEGILVTIASGNCVGVGCIAGISVPSCIENATPVGAVNDEDIIGFQRGDILDLLAPGYSAIYSTLPNNSWGLKSGTSMSAPHVAGAAALLKQFVRLYNGTDITPQEIEDIFNNTGTEIDDTSGSGRNYSRIDVYSAILALDIDNRLTIQENTAPTITANTTSPTTVYTNTDFKFNMTATDSENATFTGYVQFYVNSTASGSIQSQAMNNNTNTLIGTLGSGNFSKNYNLTAEFWAGDGADNTTKENTTIVTVDNSIPTQPSLTNPANNSYINTTITMNWTVSSDADNDTIYYYVLVNGTQACYTTDLNCSYSPSDGYYQWNVTPFDGTINGTTSSLRYYTYDITPPRPSNIGKNDSNVCVNETVLFYANWSDSIGLSHYIFSWNNSETMENDSAQSLTSWSNITREVNATNLTIVHWIIYANDSAGNWNSTGIQIFKVGNSAPTQPNLTNPANNSYTNTTITMNWTASTDTDNDIIYYYVLVNGTQACYTTDLNCSYSPTDGYYQWNVTPYDGAENGTSSVSRFYTYDTTKPLITDVSTEDVTSSGATLTTTTNENANCAYNTTDTSYASMISFSTTGGTSHSKSLTGLSASTSYTYYVRCMDTAGNIMIISNSTTFTTLSSGGSSGGGGGGSSVSYEQKSIGTLAAGSSKKITFLESDTHGITEIEVKVKNRVTNAKIRIDTGSLPSGASKPSTKGSVYKYIEITKVDITDDDIENAVIEFKVKKSWLTEKGYGIDAVILHKYHNKKWDQLETTRTGFSVEYYYYSAESPGFSTFAITAEEETAVKPAEKTTEEKVTTKETEKNMTETLPEEKLTTSKLKFNFSDMFKNIQFKINWKLMSIIIVAILTAFFIQKKWNVLKISVGMESEAIIAITGKMEKAEKLIKEGDIDSAKKTYRKILKIYNGLPVKERRWVYKEIQALYSKIKNKGK